MKKKDFKKIAMGLGVAIPACLFTVGAANAATTTTTRSSELPSVCEKLDQSNDVFSRLTVNATNYSSDNFDLGHADVHTNIGGNHSDKHANNGHTNKHTNSTQGAGLQCVHTDLHSNTSGYNKHTNTGNAKHTDQHTNSNATC